ncbi:MAG: DUF4255 domain-containing protein [bacterium]|nr:DUF4255 domain-containing protein [bacterium]
MIYEVVRILAEQVEDYIGSSVTLGNVAMIDAAESGGSGTNIENRNLLTVINMSEEGTLKNFPNTHVVGNRVEQRSPVVNLKLFVLFSSNKNQYDQALKDISKIVEFFQGKSVFTQSDTVYDRNNVDFDNLDNFRFYVDLYTPTFEELNYIWGSLGGKQIPSVLYKLTLVQIERPVTNSQSGRVSSMSTNVNLKAE